MQRPESHSVQILPPDQYNYQLVANVHPPDWHNPQPQSKYNLVVIGAGTAGLVTAAGAAGLGAKVALVERHLMGGDCLNVGCVPSKALIRASRTAAEVRRASEFGVSTNDGVQVDFGAVMERMRRLRAEISPNYSASRFRELGVDVFLGQASFIAPDKVQVGDAVLRFSKAAICTGARAVALPIPGLEEAGYLTNETVFSLTELPARLAVIGGGPIGSEMAQSFARFGAEVTLIEQAGQVLVREDDDAAAIVQQSMTDDGVQFLFNARITGISRHGNERRISVECGTERHELAVDAILLSVGRAPNVDGLGLETAGVDYDRRSGVRVDDRLRTTNRRIFAAGDIASKYKFTHAADFLARIVIQNALFMGRAKASSLTIPWCTYTDPELAHVGLSDKHAAEQGVAIRTFRQDLADVDRAILDGETAGFVKIHVEQASDKIVGATVVAAHAGDMISEITVAMTRGVGLKSLASVIHPYPTQAEAIRRVGDAYNRTRLTPTVKRLFKKWLAWTR